MGIEAILGILPLISQEASLICDLNNYFKFDHNVLLLDSSAVTDHFIGCGSSPKSVYVFESANGNVTGLESLREIKSKNTFTIVVPGSSTFEENLNLLKKVRRIHRLDKDMKLGLFFQYFTSLDELRTHFQWLKDQLIVNVFAAAYLEAIESTWSEGSLNIYIFHPFGNFGMAISTMYQEFFPSLNFNFHQHKLRVAPFVKTMDERFWLSVFKIMNATFTHKPDVNYTFDILPTLAPVVSSSSKFMMYSMYPYLLTNEKIVVPEAKPYSNFSAYLQRLTTNALFAYSLGVIALIVSILITCRYIEKKKILFFQSISDVLNLLINDNIYIKYQLLSRAEHIIIVPLTFAGLVIVNGFLSNFQSYVTKPVLQAQLKTIDELYYSPFTVTVQPGWKEVVLETFTHLSTHQDWNDKIVELEVYSFHHQIITFNTSACYLMSDIDVDMMINAQRRLNKKGFYDIGVTVSKSLNVYPISERFLFFDRLNEIVHWTHSSGLFNKWLRESSEENERIVLIFGRKRFETQLAACDVEKFSFVMIIVYGWIASTIVLMIEVVWAIVQSRHFSSKNWLN